MVGKFEAMVLDIEFLAATICCNVLVCPPVRIIFPFAVHLAEEKHMFGWDERLSDSFMVLHMTCGGGRLVRSLVAVWTTTLGWSGGLRAVLQVLRKAASTAVSVEVGFAVSEMKAARCCLSLAGGGGFGVFCRFATDFCNAVSISLNSRSSVPRSVCPGVGVGVGVGGM